MLNSCPICVHPWNTFLLNHNRNFPFKTPVLLACWSKTAVADNCNGRVMQYVTKLLVRIWCKETVGCDKSERSNVLTEMLQRGSFSIRFTCVLPKTIFHLQEQQKCVWSAGCCKLWRQGAMDPICHSQLILCSQHGEFSVWWTDLYSQVWLMGVRRFAGKIFFFSFFCVHRWTVLPQ
jgi:hypothetical protein